MKNVDFGELLATANAVASLYADKAGIPHKDSNIVDKKYITVLPEANLSEIDSDKPTNEFQEDINSEHQVVLQALQDLFAHENGTVKPLRADLERLLGANESAFASGPSRSELAKGVLTNLEKYKSIEYLVDLEKAQQRINELESSISSKPLNDYFGWIKEGIPTAKVFDLKHPQRGIRRVPKGIVKVSANAALADWFDGVGVASIEETVGDLLFENQMYDVAHDMYETVLTRKISDDKKDHIKWKKTRALFHKAIIADDQSLIQNAITDYTSLDDAFKDQSESHNDLSLLYAVLDSNEKIAIPSLDVKASAETKDIYTTAVNILNTRDFKRAKEYANKLLDTAEIDSSAAIKGVATALFIEAKDILGIELASNNIPKSSNNDANTYAHFQFGRANALQAFNGDEFAITDAINSLTKSMSFKKTTDAKELLSAMHDKAYMQDTSKTPMYLL